jgi:hypothetical protein
MPLRRPKRERSGIRLHPCRGPARGCHRSPRSCCRRSSAPPALLFGLEEQRAGTRRPGPCEQVEQLASAVATCSVLPRVGDCEDTGLEVAALLPVEALARQVRRVADRLGRRVVVTQRLRHRRDALPERRAVLPEVRLELRAAGAAKRTRLRRGRRLLRRPRVVAAAVRGALLVARAGVVALCRRTSGLIARAGAARLVGRARGLVGLLVRRAGVTRAVDGECRAAVSVSAAAITAVLAVRLIYLSFGRRWSFVTTRCPECICMNAEQGESWTHAAFVRQPSDAGPVRTRPLSDFEAGPVLPPTPALAIRASDAYAEGQE